jgi:hypothetical protein
MSLTSFIAQKDVKAKLKAYFPLSPVKLPALELIPPCTTHYSLIGTAFDYVMRFALKRLYPQAGDSAWIAEHVVQPGRLRLIIDDYRQEVAEKAAQQVALAKKMYQQYLKTGKVTDNLFVAALLLAQIDPYFRAGILALPLGEIDQEDVNDLRQLYEAVPWHHLTAKQLCLLDPTFGASSMIGGADVDLILDGRMIDIKTTIKLQVTRDHLNQLLGYYLLHRLAGINGAPKGHAITTLGIYFSRYAYVQTWPIETFIDEKHLPAILRWFVKRVEAGHEIEDDNDDEDSSASGNIGDC